MRKRAAIDHGIADALRDIGIVGEKLGVPRSVIDLGACGEPDGRRVPIVFGGELAIKITAAKRIESAHHAGKVGAARSRAQMQLARLGLRARLPEHAPRCRANISGLMRKRIVIVQTRNNVAPGQRPMGRNVVQNARIGEQFDIGAQLRVASFRPGRCGRWNTHHRQQEDRLQVFRHGYSRRTGPHTQLRPVECPP